MKVTVTGIGSELQGVGRWEDGRAVFIPGALPGETVEAECLKEAERFVEARLASVLSPAPCRKNPDCPVYGQCGGCRARHMTYEASLAFKRQIVEAALIRIGGLADPQVRETLGMAEMPDRYRNKAEYAVCPGPDGRPRVGLRAAGSAAFVPVEDCLLQHPASVAAARAAERWMQTHGLSAWDGRQGCVRGVVTRVNHRGELMLVLVTATSEPLAAPAQSLWEAVAQAAPGLVSLYRLESAPRPTHALDGRARLLLGQATLTDRLLGLDFALAPQAFFQVNRAQTEVLYTQALEAAGLTGCEEVLDAYCGAGTISLVMAKKARRVTGVEIVLQAVENARENARRNGVANARFLQGDAPKVIGRLLREGEKPDVVCVDPPRKGVDARLLDTLLSVRPARIVYVSCNPATLARDLRRLAPAYRLEYAQPVDMFPWTEHVETVCCLYHQKKDFISVPYEPKDASYLKQR